VRAIIANMPEVVFDRIECPKSCPGFPDLSYCAHNGSAEGLLEVKFGSSKKPPEFRATQKAWFRKRIQAGGRPQIWMATRDEIYVYNARIIEDFLLKGRLRFTDWLFLPGAQGMSIYGKGVWTWLWSRL